MIKPFYICNRIGNITYREIVACKSSGKSLKVVNLSKNNLHFSENREGLLSYLKNRRGEMRRIPNMFPYIQWCKRGSGRGNCPGAKVEGVPNCDFLYSFHFVSCWPQRG